MFYAIIDWVCLGIPILSIVGYSSTCPIEASEHYWQQCCLHCKDHTYGKFLRSIRRGKSNSPMINTMVDSTRPITIDTSNPTVWSLFVCTSTILTFLNSTTSKTEKHWIGLMAIFKSFPRLTYRAVWETQTPWLYISAKAQRYWVQK